MDNLNIEATNSTPAIIADASSGVVHIRGKSYPENTFEFYQSTLNWLTDYLTADGAQLKITFESLYFNSSTSQVFYDLFDLLEEARGAGKAIVVNWEYDEENVSAEEAGEDLKEDFEAIDFHLVVKNS
jgi:hypothetical protein